MRQLVHAAVKIILRRFVLPCVNTSSLSTVVIFDFSLLIGVRVLLKLIEFPHRKCAILRSCQVVEYRSRNVVPQQIFHIFHLIHLVQRDEISDRSCSIVNAHCLHLHVFCTALCSRHSMTALAPLLLLLPDLDFNFERSCNLAFQPMFHVQRFNTMSCYRLGFRIGWG